MSSAAPRAGGARSVAAALQVPAWLVVYAGGVTAPVGVALAALALGCALACPPAGTLREANLLTRVAIDVLVVSAALALLFSLPGPRANFGIAVTAFGGSLAALRVVWGLNGLRLGGALGLGLLALMGQARAVPRPVYGAAVALFLVCALLAAVRADATWPALRRHVRGLALPLAIALAVALGIMGGLGWALPAAEPAVSKALRPYLFGTASGESGFGDGRMALGDIGKVVTSDEVVMRVYGPLDHLRGRVYVNYYRGHWSTRTPPGYEPPRVEGGTLGLGAPRDDAPAPVRLEAEPDAGDALFAPLGAAGLAAAPEGSSLDAYGVATVPPEIVTEPRSWQVVPGRPHARVLEPPSRRDTTVRDHRFGQLARRWVEGATSDRQRVARLMNRLTQTFTYTLDVGPAPRGEEPVYWFLTQRQAGHCEYFASALALLARGLDIPARVVAGYRVFEHNALGGYWIVRKRDAHAWTEVYLDGRWETFDPTPPGSIEGEQRTEASWLGARWDLLRRWFGATFERLASLTALELVSALGVAGSLLLLFVWVRRRGERAAPAAPPDRFAPLERLEAHLGARPELGRPPAEPLSTWAERLRAAGEPEAADLVDACGAWRYGGRGDPGRLDGAVDAFLARARARAAAQ